MFAQQGPSPSISPSTPPASWHKLVPHSWPSGFISPISSVYMCLRGLSIIFMGIINQQTQQTGGPPPPCFMAPGTKWLVEFDRQISMRLHPIGVGRIHRRFAGRPGGSQLAIEAIRYMECLGMGICFILILNDVYMQVLYKTQQNKTKHNITNIIL